MAKEVQMAARAANSTARTTPPHHHHSGGGGAATAGKPVPGYLRPSAGSCHHVCKYGGTHTFDDKEAKKPHHHPKPARRQPPPAPQPESQSRMMVKVRSVFRRRVGDSSRAAEKAAATAKAAAAGKAKESGEGVEWKDIVAYDSTVVPPHGSSSPQPEKISAPVAVSGDGKKKNDVTKGKKSSRDKAKITTGQVDGVQLQTQDEKAMVKNAKIDTKSVKPPKGKKKPKSLLVEKHPIDDQDTPLHGYQVLSPSLPQSRASLLHELEEEMVNEDTNNMKETKPTYSLDEEECAAAAETSSRPIPAHRRAKSMSISSRSVRFPFVRQASKNSATFKLRSRSTKAPPILPLEEEKKLVRLRSRRGEDPAGSTGRGIQLRIRSLRRRGVGGSGGSGTGFVVPAVALRHQKTLEKKRSQRLYNNMIEETAGKLVKARKSKVKALVGAFESVISKIAK